MADRQEGRWALVVHGGAKKMEPGEEKANRAMEDLPVLNAGRGSITAPMPPSP